MPTASATRGFGLLENVLARLRAKQANKLIGDRQRDGRILDIGCGAHPYFLRSSGFGEKHGADRIDRDADTVGDIRLHMLDLERFVALPFEDEHFDVVTMLAVVEHLELETLPQVFDEARRVLKVGGTLILTTPASWIDKILRAMAAMRLLSPHEIDEHKTLFTRHLATRHLVDAGFEKDKTEVGLFELGTNIYAAAIK